MVNIKEINMASRNSMAFLQRQNIFQPPVRHTAKFATNSQLSHFRPIVHSADLFGPDRPARRVLTQDLTQRIPYQPVPDSITPCGGACDQDG